MHLTNYSVNKHNKNFIKNEGCDKDDIGHKRSLTYILKYLKYRGKNEKKI